jgi:cysteine synthase
MGGMLKAMDILDAIGSTSLVRLRKVIPPQSAEVLVKLEWENPNGSVKDRMAHAVILRAEAAGWLNPGDTVVEYGGRLPEPTSPPHFKSRSGWGQAPRWSR